MRGDEWHELSLLIIMRIILPNFAIAEPLIKKNLIIWRFMHGFALPKIPIVRTMVLFDSYL
ncbi:hypothetical protein B0189_07405 [Moraxella cuniculi]|nr:hypothetical protein B0189_07405 [Moraxella cuniculi]